MARLAIAPARVLLTALAFASVFLYSPGTYAQTVAQIPEEVYTSIREAKDVLGAFLLLLLWFLLGVGVTSSCLLGRAFFVDLSNQVDALARSVTPWKSFSIGALNFIILFLIALALASLGWWVIVSALIFLSLATMTYIGLLATSTILGEKILAIKTGEASDFARVVAGNVTLFTAFLIPVFGQLFFLYIILKSFGISLIWLFRRKA